MKITKNFEFIYIYLNIYLIDLFIFIFLIYIYFDLKISFNYSPPALRDYLILKSLLSSSSAEPAYNIQYRISL